MRIKPAITAALIALVLPFAAATTASAAPATSAPIAALDDDNDGGLLDLDVNVGGGDYEDDRDRNDDLLDIELNVL